MFIKLTRAGIGGRSQESPIVINVREILHITEQNEGEKKIRAIQTKTKTFYIVETIDIIFSRIQECL